MPARTEKVIPLKFPDPDLIGVTELKMRPPRTKDRIAAQRGGGSQGEQEVLLFATLCSVAQTVIENLEDYDYNKIAEAYDFFAAGKHYQPKKD